MQLRRNNTTFQLQEAMQISYFLILFLSILLSGSSLFLFGKIGNKTLKLILAFSGAYLFSLSLIHLLPEVYDSGGATIGIFILAGFFLQVVLEIFLLNGIKW